MSDHAQEIIIIKRHGDHEDGHHGGAWKIALADFMTAMMALFLVMWLINSTSKEQKQTIAEYFNPVKLAEVTHDRKGVNDPQDTPNDPAPSGKGKGDGGNAEGKGDAAGAPGSRARESALFQDPYAVLAKLAAEAEAAGPEAASADASAVEAGQPGVAGGETGRDPFDPLYWQVAALPRRRTDNPGALDTAAAAPAEARLDARAQITGPKPKDLPKESAKDVARQSLNEAMRQAGVKLASAEPMPLAVPSAEAAKPPSETAPHTSPPELKTAPPEPTLLAKAETPAAKELAAGADQTAKAAETAALSALKAEIARAVPSLPNGAPAPQVEVRRTGEGVLISITDEINFSMFGIGSAEPTPKVVKALERIAKILNSRPGRVVVRGHTDGRPFRSETYDNWRLSSARAQMASYMLVRGGLDEARIDRIEGYADRQPRIAANPKAAENRRIEILLRGLPE
ncbi:MULTISPECIES: MotB family protein [Methylorubrum]|uniref:MotB family protein n=1 Tax=Methylorubrum TaxID=2282523 RepID=UPI0020A1E37D|nr:MULTISPECIES: MotB family protein [Methylorubrum]MCP1551316.1 chemotaxis protein MotB [Methylorubrum zatmanii]MCP1552068.1 chemotaxis protein MotB [Methylorubrum extorquens]MCP1581621.1 chemotaxis protein MotB [Methylorubrum extorquens]